VDFRVDDGRETLLIATRSHGKLNELVSLLDGVPFRCVSLEEAGIPEEVPETGSTLEENAAIKADGYARLSGMLTLADDTGLEVDALGGEPGVRSARYAPGSSQDRIDFLLRNLGNVDPADMSARFRCVIAIASPGASAALYEGVCEGRILRDARGGGGFGYDPIFFVPELGKTMAELTTEEKNRVSHRGIAARKAAMALMSMNEERKAS
jgi:XTP/dITP diphosphohydrolase